MDTAFDNLNEVVAMTTEPADQNPDNIQIISSFFSKTASVLNQSSAEGNIEPAVIEMVSYFKHICFSHFNILLSLSSFHMCILPSVK